MTDPRKISPKDWPLFVEYVKWIVETRPTDVKFIIGWIDLMVKNAPDEVFGMTK